MSGGHISSGAQACAARRGLALRGILLATPSAALLLPSPAWAGSLGPPTGNSVANQYLETVPTAGGGRSTATLHASGGNSRGTARGSVSDLPPATQTTLSTQGSAGQRVAALAASSAPAGKGGVRRHARTRSHRAHSAATGSPSGPRSPGPKNPISPSGGSPASTLAQSITGGSGAGGSSFLLPVLLVIIAVGGGVLTVVRR